MCIWDEIFEANSIEGHSDAHLCAVALSAWGNCIAGNECHQNFGDVLTAIGYKLNIIATPENLSAWAKEHGFLVDTQNNLKCKREYGVSATRHF